jgi:hypothetical protein
LEVEYGEGNTGWSVNENSELDMGKDGKNEWIFKLKVYDSVARHKARLATKRFHQTSVIDF